MFGTTTPGFGAFGASPAVATGGTNLFSPSPSLATPGAGGFGFGSPLLNQQQQQKPPSTGLFGAAASTPSFGLGSATPAFGTGLNMFNNTAKPSAGLGMTPPAGQFPGLGTPGATPNAQVAHLARKDRHPVTYSTKVEDLDDASRQLLLELEKKVKQHRDHKRQLEAFERLQVGSGSSSNQRSKLLKEELDMEVHVLSKKVQGLLSLLKADKQSLDSLYQICMKLVRRTEALSNASQRLKLRATTMQQMQNSNHAGVMPLPVDLGFRPPTTPSPFLLEALSNFEHAFDQISHVVAELEQLHLHGGQPSQEVRGLMLQSGVKGAEMDKSMSKILDNFVVYFNHVLAQYSQVHEKLRHVKKDFNASQKQQGVNRDYFAEADRKAVAAEERLKKEAEQKKQQAFAAANPTQPQPQPQAQQPGVPQLGFGAPTTATTPLGGLGTATPGLFSTPQQAPAQSTSLFSPASTTFGMAPTQPGAMGFSPFGGASAFGAPAPSASGGGKKKSNSKRGK